MPCMGEKSKLAKSIFVNHNIDESSMAIRHSVWHTSRNQPLLLLYLWHRTPTMEIIIKGQESDVLPRRKPTWGTHLPVCFYCQHSKSAPTTADYLLPLVTKDCEQICKENTIEKVQLSGKWDKMQQDFTKGVFCEANPVPSVSRGRFLNKEKEGDSA